MLTISLIMVARGPEPRAGSFLNFCKIRGIDIATITERKIPKNIDNPKITPKEGSCHQKKATIAKITAKIRARKLPILISLKKYFFRTSLGSRAMPLIISVSV